jgi:hypothetical protein
MKNWDNWKGFERLVAAIHISEGQGGIVKWNDKINNRQFDVTIRFKYSGYDYLTVIECKDTAAKVPVSEVEAFVTKSRDINSNKAIMVSPVGFQEGCVEVSNRYGIELLILNENQKLSPAILSGIFTPVINYSEISFIRSDNDEEIEFPKSPGGKLLFLVKKAEIETPSEKISIDKLLRRWYLRNQNKIGREIEYIQIKMPQNSKLWIPNPVDKEIVPIRYFRFACKIVEGRYVKLSGLDTKLEDNKLKTISLKSINGENVIEKKVNDIQYGFDNVLKKEIFYRDPSTEFVYYLKEIENDLARWIMIESYQHGSFIQVEFTQTIENANLSVKDYIEITDKNEIERLNKILERYLKK